MRFISVKDDDAKDIGKINKKRVQEEWDKNNKKTEKHAIINPYDG